MVVFQIARQVGFLPTHEVDQYGLPERQLAFAWISLHSRPFEVSLAATGIVVPLKKLGQILCCGAVPSVLGSFLQQRLRASQIARGFMLSDLPLQIGRGRRSGGKPGQTCQENRRGNPANCPRNQTIECHDVSPPN